MKKTTKRRAVERAPVAWTKQLRADERALARGIPTRASRKTVLEASARLADSRYAGQLDGVLGAFHDAVPTVELALANGRRALVHDRPAEALRWLVHAQSLVSAKAPAIVARIAFLLGSVYISSNELVAADAVLAWVEGILGDRAAKSADVLHLQALIAEGRGHRDDAMTLYREVLKRANFALTPMTRVLALRNLAEAITHSQPQESAALYGLALAVLDTDELDSAMRCAIDNGMGYALLCSGDIDGARLKLQQALTEAGRVASRRVQLYAKFNLAIVDELGGDLAEAQTALEDVEANAARSGIDELVGWVRIRIVWLVLRSAGREAAAAAFRKAFPSTPGKGYRDAIAVLSALIHLQDRRASSRAELASLAAIYRERGDALTDFTLTLWLAHADAAGGRTAAARRNVRHACALGSERGFRLGTSWWSAELVDVARGYAAPESTAFVERLFAPPASPGAAPVSMVIVSRHGSISVDGDVLDAEVWRVGRSGSGVLLRYFRALLSAYPAALARDALADLLWPQSEGDKAIRNLYAATKDLRRVLAGIPGMRLEVAEGAYRLDLGSNISVQ